MARPFAHFEKQPVLIPNVPWPTGALRSPAARISITPSSHHGRRSWPGRSLNSPGNTRLSPTQVERDLIEALSARYANPQPKDRSPLDRAYAEAMRKVWKAHRYDPEVGALFAEAMMDLRPWDHWAVDGQPQPGTDEILATLDAVLKGGTLIIL